MPYGLTVQGELVRVKRIQSTGCPDVITWKDFNDFLHKQRNPPDNGKAAKDALRTRPDNSPFTVGDAKAAGLI